MPDRGLVCAAGSLSCARPDRHIPAKLSVQVPTSRLRNTPLNTRLKKRHKPDQTGADRIHGEKPGHRLPMRRASHLPPRSRRFCPVVPPIHRLLPRTTSPPSRLRLVRPVPHLFNCSLKHSTSRAQAKFSTRSDSKRLPPLRSQRFDAPPCPVGCADVPLADECLGGRRNGSGMFSPWPIRIRKGNVRSSSSMGSIPSGRPREIVVKGDKDGTGFKLWKRSSTFKCPQKRIFPLTRCA